MRAETGRFCNKALEKPKVKQGQDWHRGGCVDLLCVVSEGRKPVFKLEYGEMLLSYQVIA